MAKPNTQIPDPRIVIVRPDTDKDYFEVYLMEPVKIGAITRLGPHRYGTDDGASGFKNMLDACESILRTIGKNSIAANVSKFMTARRGDRKPPTSTPVTGAELLRSGKWLEYCEVYRRDPGSVKPAGLYPISLEERKKWGVSDDKDNS